MKPVLAKSLHVILSQRLLVLCLFAYFQSGEHEEDGNEHRQHSDEAGSDERDPAALVVPIFWGVLGMFLGLRI